MSRIANPGVAAQGRDQLDWAEHCMPVLRALRDRFAAARPLRGERLAACVHVTKETAVLIRTAAALGAEVSLTGGNPVTTQDDAAAALDAEGIAVFSWRGMTADEVEGGIEQTLTALSGPPTLFLDDGGHLISVAQKTRPEMVRQAAGAAEKTTAGVWRLREMHRQGQLTIPVLAVNDLSTKWDFDNTYGVGQSTIDAILRASGRLLAGKTFVVAGFGHVGRGVAIRAKGMGAHVAVTCRSARTALRAHWEGFRVMPMDEAAAIADFICTTTGLPDIVVGRHIDLLRDGAVLCNSGWSDIEINLGDLAARTVAKKQVRPHMTAHTLQDGRQVCLLAAGDMVNLAAGEGNPSEVMDLSFANILLALVCLVEQRGRLAPGVHDLPDSQDQEVAYLKLAAMGVAIDGP